MRLTGRTGRHGGGGGDRGGHWAHHAPPSGPQEAGCQRSGGGAARRPAAHRENGRGETPMITLAQLLTLSGILFSLAIAGVFLNRKNVILLLMCVELLLLAPNFNFIAFSRYLAAITGQLFFFSTLTF